MSENKILELASEENILMTKQEVEPPIMRETGVIGINYTKINDIAVAGVLTKRGEKFVFKQHTWICANSADLPRIKFPYMEAVAAGDAEIVDAPEIPPELIADWVAEQATFYNIPMLALDDYRYALMKNALARVGFSCENKNIKLVRPSDQIKVDPIIDSAFRNQNIVYGDCPIMRWYTNNTKKVKSERYGNYEYKKSEAKSRKTDGFFAFVAAVTQHELIPGQQVDNEEEYGMKEKKSLLEETEDYLIRKLKQNTITAQEIAVIPKILAVPELAAYVKRQMMNKAEKEGNLP